MRTREEVKRTVSDSEILGRELTKKLCKQNGWKFTEGDDINLPYDCFIGINGERCMGEIKVRNVKFIRKPTLHFEVKKYNMLMEENEREEADKVFYINWLGDTCFIFNITDSLIESTPIEQSLSNKVTARSTEDKIYKDMYLLPKWKAKRYKLGDYERIYNEIVEEFNLNL